MLYAILCYHDEAVVGSWSKEEPVLKAGKPVTVTGLNATFIR